MSVIDLGKGDAIDLSKGAGHKEVKASLSWNPMMVGGQPVKVDVDVTASGLIYGAGGQPKLADSAWFVFYNNLISPFEAIRHTGDDTTGGKTKSGENETILFNLEKMPAEIREVSIVVSIHNGTVRGHHFGSVSDARLSVIDTISGESIGVYNLKAEYDGLTVIHIGSFFRDGSSWSFKVIGQGSVGTLVDVITKYGSKSK